MALIPIDDARSRVLAAVSPLGSEFATVSDAVGRYLTADLLSAGDLPPFSASAMDGYALTPGPENRRLRVIGESRAGSPSQERLPDGAAARVSTGAEIPPGASAVIRQEDVQVDGETIVLRRPVADGENVRAAGEVLRSGQVVLGRGARVGAAELAVAISSGASQLSVGRRPRVSILSTGDELRDPGQALGPGEIHDSNGPMLAALARRAGAVSVAVGRLPDDLEATRSGLDRALSGAEVVIVAGGVSVGPHDHVRPALAELGVQELLWGVALQPGKPTWVGARSQTLVFGLPGNPVSAAVTFVLFAQPALAALQGATEPLPRRLRAVLASEVRQNPSREQALRVRLEHRGDGLAALPTGPQGSHYVTSLLGADALALIPAGGSVLPAGSPVDMELLPR